MAFSGDKNDDKNVIHLASSTMSDVMSTLRRNRKFYILVIAAVLVIYFLLWPSKESSPVRTVVVHYRDTRRTSFFLREVKTNDTLLKLILEQQYDHPGSKQALKTYLRPDQYPSAKLSFQPHVLRVSNDFDINNDVIVYLHIQKAGGTIFNEHLMKDLNIETPCRCEKSMVTSPCHCKTKQGNIWLFSWFSVGWPCGLHADWTMLHECVDAALNEIEGKTRSRRYFYVTLLRDPLARYLSEWRHHAVGQHWKDGKLRCGGKAVSLFDVRPCFNERTWEGVSLYSFMDCRENLATNRLTRMLADLTKSNCYHRDRGRAVNRSRLRLDSAIENIGTMAFFGLTESQRETKALFEKTFGLKFGAEFGSLDEDEGGANEQITDEEFVEIMNYIQLDVQLYLYAKELFSARIKVIS